MSMSATTKYAAVLAEVVHQQQLHQQLLQQVAVEAV